MRVDIFSQLNYEYGDKLNLKRYCQFLMVQKKRTKKRPKKKSRIRILLYLCMGMLFFMLLAAGLTAGYCLNLSREIEDRFSGRKWSIPSKVYSDSLLLYPGQNFRREAIFNKLVRLGYHEVDRSPRFPGEYTMDRNRLKLFLHPLETPEQSREGFPVKITFNGDRIVFIQDLERQKNLPLLELEPEEIMLFFGPERERRQLISIDQLPRHVINAVLAAEDARYYTHNGMDFRGILRAFVVNLRHAAIKQGGSTITQQLAKNYFLTPERSYSRKLKELCMSVTMEVMYTKDEILEIYLNEIYFGQKGSAAVNGIGEAAAFYFDKPASNLTIAEAAAIAGLIRGPNRYSPYVNEERCRIRRNQVIETMYKNGWITKMQYHTAMVTPLTPSGFHAFGKKAPYFMDYLTEQLKDLYSSKDLASLGLSIYTTLDTDVQNAAERALEKGLANLEKANPKLVADNGPLQGVVIVLQPQTGYILAMVGGRDYNTSQFNRAVHARRQPGSAFKPFVFAAGLDTFTPASLLSNVAKTYDIDGKQWKPKNYAEMDETEVRMRTALARSVNLATVELAMATGLHKIGKVANNFGFTTIRNVYPSIALGAAPVMPLELARAYCPFAASGRLPYPLSLKRVDDENRQTLQMRHMTVSAAISPEKAFLVNSMLQSVVTEGTARSLKYMGITFPVCGKTGTTNGSRDAWFIGFTPDILALVWVGFDNGASIHASGARAALPVWGELINQLPQYVSGNTFIKPPGVVKKVICPETGLLAVKDRCPNPLEEFFLKENAPETACGVHRKANPIRQVIDNVKGIFK